MIQFLRFLRPVLLPFVCVVLNGLLSMPAGSAEQDKAAPTNKPPVDYMLIVTGEELLRGAFSDLHTAFITRTLHLLGCHCTGSLIVDDNPEEIREALKFASQKVKLVIVTGGLGPTVNDVTRTAVADFTGIKLTESPEALADLERRLQQPRSQLRENQRRQTLVPSRGTYLKNPQGTAVGLVFEPEGAVVVALPGPPRELKPMVTNELVPFLQRKFGLRSPGSSLTLRFVGVGQSQIDQTIREHVQLPPDVVVGSVFEGSRVDFVFALPGDSSADRARLRQIEDQLRKHLADNFYADDGATLEELVVKKIMQRAKSLVLAEVGTGGHLAASLNGAEGIESLLKSAFVAPTDERMRQTLEIPDKGWKGLKPGPEQLKAVATAAQKRTGNGFQVVVSQIEREDNGSKSVWVAFGSAPDKLEVQRLPVQGVGELAHANLVTGVLDRLRRHFATEK